MSEVRAQWGWRVFSKGQEYDLEGTFGVVDGVLTVGPVGPAGIVQHRAAFAAGSWDRIEALAEDPEIVRRKRDEERRIDEALSREFQRRATAGDEGIKAAMTAGLNVRDAFVAWKSRLDAKESAVIVARYENERRPW